MSQSFKRFFHYFPSQTSNPLLVLCSSVCLILWILTQWFYHTASIASSLPFLLISFSLLSLSVHMLPLLTPDYKYSYTENTFCTIFFWGSDGPACTAWNFEYLILLKSKNRLTLKNLLLSWLDRFCIWIPTGTFLFSICMCWVPVNVLQSKSMHNWLISHCH